MSKVYLRPCPGCSQHIRMSERACPFCGVSLDASSIPASPQNRGRTGGPGIHKRASGALMRTSYSPVVPLFVVGVITACGGSTGVGSGGSGSVSGTVGGASFTVASELAFIEPADTTSGCSGTSDGGEVCTSTSTGQGVIVV